jgi:hypothetical protein
MFATIHQFRQSTPRGIDGPAAELVTGLHQGIEPLGTCTLSQMGGPEGAVVALWSDRASAEEAATRRVDASGATPLETRVFSLAMHHEGLASTEAAAIAQLTSFDGPRTKAQADAADRAGRDRLWPAIKDLDGIADVWVLRGNDNSTVVVALCTTIETIQTVATRVMSTELLPDEDPALLSDPSRIDIMNVVASSMPATDMVEAGGVR